MQSHIHVKDMLMIAFKCSIYVDVSRYTDFMYSKPILGNFQLIFQLNEQILQFF